MKIQTYIFLGVIFLSSINLSLSAKQSEIEEIPVNNDTSISELPAESVAKEENLVDELTFEEETSSEEEAPAEEDVPAQEEVPTEEEAPAEEDIPAEEEAPVEEDVPAEEEALAEEENGSSLALFGFIIFFITLMLLLIVTTLLLKQVKWRKRYAKGESIVFPDAHLDFLEKLKNSYERLYGQVIDFGNASLGSQKNNESLTSQMIESMTNLNTTIDSQNKEIERLKQGYDYSIKKNSILPLIELNELVKGYMLDDQITEETKAKLDSIKKYLMSYLEEMDVFEFEIEKGKSTRELSSDAFEIDDVEITNNDELNDKVALTTKNGYENVHANGKNILKKAKVLVYKKEKDNG
tara:strand:- start:1149 stop:2204 length:1056 start_codon:yes stop_codon:yes gene_type:complete